MAKHYLIYRLFSVEERRNKSSDRIFYGWSDSKGIVQAFSSQRNMKKYQLYQFDGRVDENTYIPDKKIVLLRVKSAESGEMVSLFMTMDEIQDVEKKIQRMFQDLSSLCYKEGKDEFHGSIEDHLTLFMNIERTYADALYYIGYRPKEVEQIFDSYADGHGTVYDEIDMAYQHYPTEDYYDAPVDMVPGLATIEDISSRVLYSLENFISVMRADM